LKSWLPPRNLSAKWEILALKPVFVLVPSYQE